MSDFLGDIESFDAASVAARGERIDSEYRRRCVFATLTFDVASFLDVPREVRRELQAWLGEQHRISRGLDPRSGDKTTERRRVDQQVAREAERTEE